MKKIRVGVIICVVMLSITSCEKGGAFCYKPDGDTVTEERIHTGFTDVSLEIGADLYIEQGEEYSVEIETSENLLEIIKTDVHGSTLEIDLKKGKCIRGDYEIKIYITLPSLEEVSISGSGDVYVKNKMIADKLDISISGSGNFELDSLYVNELEASISGSGDLMLTSLDTAYSQEIRISGSGEIRAINMPVLNSEINISGSGHCEVHAIDRLDIAISGSGDVYYKGNPIIDQHISGSGSIRPY